MEIYLIRHTTPLIPKGVIYGQSDIPLTADFPLEANQVLKKCESITFGSLYSSPLERCVKLAGKIDKNIKTDRRLMELNFGDWEGKRWDDIDDDQLAYWMENYVTAHPPNGESMMDLKDRISGFISDLKKIPNQKTPVALVTHAGVIRMIRVLTLQTPPEDMFDLHLDYGEVFYCDLKRGVFEQVS